jgi:predicted small metal-binding protein
MAPVRKCGRLLVVATITILVLSSTVSSQTFCYNGTLPATGNPTYLMSPNYPNNYTSNTNCQWTIRAASSSEVVVLEVLTFELENSMSCIYDYVAVYDGYSPSFPLLKKLCGTTSSLRITSTGSYLTVVFHSDQSVESMGFKFQYTSQPKPAQRADVNLTASTTAKYFSSSNYPGQYPSNMDCNWFIKADSASKVVVLDMIALSLDYNSSCTSDYVKIYDGPSTYYSTVIATLCGVYYYGTYKSTGSDMTVVFHSDVVSSGNTGFQFSYKSEIPASGIPGTIAQCANVSLTASTYANYFNSLNYPGQYPSNMDCKWFIKADSALEVVVLDISAFSIDYTSSCAQEYVKIYDGPSTYYSTVIATLCSIYYYRTYKSTGSYMTVVFHSDGVNSTNTGFKFSYKSEIPVSDSPRTINYKPSSSTSSSTYLPGYIAGPIIVIVVSLISTVCCRRRVVRRQLSATQMVRTAQIVTTAPAPRPAPPPMPAPNITANQNGSQANVFFVTFESNNQAEATWDTQSPHGTSGTQQIPQAPPEPPKYSTLSSDMNAGLPPYDPRYPDYRANNLPPAYSEVAGGAAPYGQKSLPYDPKPDKSPFGLGSSSDEAGYANMGFSSAATTGPPTSSHRDTEPSAPVRDSIYNN